MDQDRRDPRVGGTATATPATPGDGTRAASPIALRFGVRTTVVVGERREVWFSYRATKAGLVHATTVGSGYDTWLAVSAGAGLDEVKAADAAGRSRPSSVTFQALVGTTYSFQVTHWYGDAPGGDTTVTFHLGPG